MDRLIFKGGLLSRNWKDSQLILGSKSGSELHMPAISRRIWRWSEVRAVSIRGCMGMKLLLLMKTSSISEDLSGEPEKLVGSEGASMDNRQEVRRLNKFCLYDCRYDNPKRCV